MSIIAYVILFMMIILIPWTITVGYYRLLYMHKKDEYAKPYIIFLIALAVELVYLLYLYLFKMK